MEKECRKRILIKSILFFLLVSGIIFLSISQGSFNAAGESSSHDQLIENQNIGVYLPCILHQYGTPTPFGNLLPDLTVPGVQVTYYGCPWDQPGHVRVPVQNIGNSDTGSFIVDIHSKFFPVSTLPAQEEIVLTREFSRGPVGAVFVFADSNQQVVESNEDNNEFRIIYTPPLYCTSSPTPTPSNN